MSFLVRHKDTGRYLCGQDDWTAEEADALQFSSGLKLIDYIERGGAHERPEAMEIVVCPDGVVTGQGNSGWVPATA
jgi:hypothetical protein